MKKLRKVLRIREIAERESAQALARSQAARAEAQATHADLCRMMAQYREQHSSRTHSTGQQLRQFLRFYEQMSTALDAQRKLMEQLSEVEAADRNTHLKLYRDRVALERLLAERDRVHRFEQGRAERRNAIRRQPTRFV